ncbi:MAG TPA: 4a-hydroxytetrahydrobiopterin dehydratase [Nitrospiria bacterium]|jgi:4a-hydroxytetrahydrobiopterin dehydratase|nr:4a-hydroxytetrahydrobiopterin dehydratase [Nitrospiria bacterium]
MAEKLSTAEIQQQLKALSGWQWADNAIKKPFDFDSFMAAIRFVNRVAELAEAVDHHPDITINYRKVTMALTTHSAGGLTQKDFALAGRIEGAAGEPR